MLSFVLAPSILLSLNLNAGVVTAPVPAALKIKSSFDLEASILLSLSVIPGPNKILPVPAVLRKISALDDSVIISLPANLISDLNGIEIPNKCSLDDLKNELLKKRLC